MLRRVVATIRRYRMFEPGARVGVAVSGGADSVCLLALLRELAPEWGLRLSVLHFNHRLRGPDSDADAAFVAALAERFGLPLRSASAEVAVLAAARRENLEQAARLARREFFLRLLAAGELDRVALGHTRSDQAETVLLHLLRGAGLSGLAAMRPCTPEGFVRPLIEVGRSEVERYLEERGLRWRQDVSNWDLRFARNRLRRQWLPQLASEFNPALEQTLAQTAALAREDEDYWSAEIERLAGALLLRRGDAVLLRVEALRSLHPAVARRLLRRAIAEVKGDLRRLEFRHVERALELACRQEGHGRVALPGLELERSLGWVRLGPPAAPGCGYRLRVEAPGVVRPPGADYELRLELGVAGGAGDALEWSKLGGPLELRNWQPGDRYRPVGQVRPLKLKELFQKAGIPLWERAKWPIMVYGREIVWARRFGPAAEYAASDGAAALVIHEQGWQASQGPQPAAGGGGEEKGDAKGGGGCV